MWTSSRNFEGSGARAELNRINLIRAHVTRLTRVRTVSRRSETIVSEMFRKKRGLTYRCTPTLIERRRAYPSDHNDAFYRQLQLFFIELFTNRADFDRPFFDTNRSDPKPLFLLSRGRLLKKFTRVRYSRTRIVQRGKLQRITVRVVYIRLGVLSLHDV